MAEVAVLSEGEIERVLERESISLNTSILQNRWVLRAQSVWGSARCSLVGSRLVWVLESLAQCSAWQGAGVEAWTPFL